MDVGAHLRDQIAGLCRVIDADDWDSLLAQTCSLLLSATQGDRALLFIMDATGQALELATTMSSAGDNEAQARRIEIDPAIGSRCPLAQVALTGRLLRFANGPHGYDFARLEGLIASPSQGNNFAFLPLRGKQESGLIGIAVVEDERIVAEVDDQIVPLLATLADMLARRIRADRQSNELRSVRYRLARQEDEQRQALQQQVADIEARFVGNSPAIRTMRDRLAQYAAKDHAVLILGEQGSGKERAAREIHRLSRKRFGNFVYFDCASVPPHALMSELCGYKRGAVPGQAAARRGLLREASGGTLFLDRIDLVPQEAQMFLARLLETGQFRTLGSERESPVEARLLFAALPDLPNRAESGAFLPSLSFALLRYVLRMPSLRDRAEDITPIVESILNRVVSPTGEQLSLSHTALAVLHSLDYPANLRQIEALVERAIGLAGDGDKTLSAAHVEAARNGHQSETHSEVEGLREAVARFESDLIRRALNLSSGDRAKAAELLQIPKRTLADKCIRYAL